MDTKYELNVIIKCSICNKTIINTICSDNKQFSDQDKIKYQKELENEHIELHNKASDYARLKNIVDYFIMDVKGIE